METKQHGLCLLRRCRKITKGNVTSGMNHSQYINNPSLQGYMELKKALEKITIPTAATTITKTKLL